MLPTTASPGCMLQNRTEAAALKETQDGARLAWPGEKVSGRQTDRRAATGTQARVCHLLGSSRLNLQERRFLWLITEQEAFLKSGPAGARALSRTAGLQAKGPSSTFWRRLCCFKQKGLN